jgi:hypothetical protein
MPISEEGQANKLVLLTSHISQIPDAAKKNNPSEQPIAGETDVIARNFIKQLCSLTNQPTSQ